MGKNTNGTAEIPESAGVTLTINTDANGLKPWNEAHGRHIQKGPDVLTFATPSKNLNFKTTFTPAPGAGKDLQCIIAGEIITLAVREMKPKDWRGLADKLTTRNTTPIKGKSAAEKYIEKTLKAQRAASDTARFEFEETGNPKIVIEYIKKSKSGAALQETWINEAIQKFIRTDRSDLLKAAFLPRRGENKEARRRAIESMIFAERIDKSRRAGQSLNTAFITELQKTGDGNLEGDALNKKLTAIRNKYNRAKRIKPEITIQETVESFAITAFPGKITQGDLAGFGDWKITFPKK